MDINYQELYEAKCTAIQQLQSINEQLQIEIQTLKLQLAQIRKMIYGSRQEKFVPQGAPDQLSLDLSTEDTPVPVNTSVQKISYERITTRPVPTNGNHPGRYKLPEHLERRIIEITPEVTESMVKIGEEITEELELEPGRLYVNRYVRPKYVDKQS